MAASASQIEVSGAAFVPMCVKAHGSTPRSASPVIQFAIAKTVPLSWAGRRAQEPAARPTTAPSAPHRPAAVAHHGTDIPRADFIPWVVLVSACERSLGVVSPYPIKVSRAPLTSFRRLADHPGLGRAVSLGIHGHPSISSPVSSAQRDAPIVPTVGGRVSHVDLDGKGVSLRANASRHPTEAAPCFYPSRIVRRIKSGPPFGLAVVLRVGIFFLIFFPREVDGTDKFDSTFGLTQLETAGTDCAVTPVSMGSSTQSRTSECDTGASAFGNISLDVYVTVPKINVIRTVMDWNGEISQ